MMFHSPLYGFCHSVIIHPASEPTMLVQRYIVHAMAACVHDVDAWC
jgi:hypothetical protein